MENRTTAQQTKQITHATKTTTHNEQLEQIAETRRAAQTNKQRPHATNTEKKSTTKV